MNFDTENRDKIFDLLHFCRKNLRAPDLHSFTIKIKCGTAFVEARNDNEAEMLCILSNGKAIGWAGTYIAAANRLANLGADFSTAKIN